MSSIVLNGNSNKLTFNRRNFSSASKVNNGQYNVIVAEDEVNAGSAQTSSESQPRPSNTRTRPGVVNNSGISANNNGNIIERSNIGISSGNSRVNNTTGINTPGTSSASSTSSTPVSNPNNFNFQIGQQ